MSDKSNNQGRAYEYIFLNSLYEAIQELRPAEKVLNSSYHAAQRAWDAISSEERSIYEISAKSAISTLFALEPNMVEHTQDMLRIYIQTDREGEEADVRDIIIERKGIVWEVGLSIKHNHMAVKHSRLSHVLDFGKKWYDVPCSKRYWSEIKPVFEYLETCKEEGLYFRELPSKEDDVYVPLLKAFMKEVKKQISKNESIPRKLVEYLLSKYDFYKVISVDKLRITTIQSFNMYGTLNKPSREKKPTLGVPLMVLPSSLIHIGFSPDSKTTVLMCFDNGWQFSFRIHNAKDTIEKSLKFDIQIVGVPSIVDIKFNCKWD